MREATFLQLVEQAADITREDAEQAAHAVLRTLSERLTLGEATDIAAFLPRELRADLTSARSSRSSTRPGRGVPPRPCSRCSRSGSQVARPRT
jgi:uncharacterized protein (DUF2267 family)